MEDHRQPGDQSGSCDVLPAEGIDDQRVADHAGDADAEDDGADGVVGVVGHVHRGERVRGLRHHHHLGDGTEVQSCCSTDGH